MSKLLFFFTGGSDPCGKMGNQPLINNVVIGIKTRFVIIKN